MPTFCRGWGKLPFDRSGADLTAHALSAWQAWLPEREERLQAAMRRAISRALSYLERTQNPDGSWTPLWFGNEQGPDEANLTYGTARTAIALARSRTPMLVRALRWIEMGQNRDGGWGGAPGAPSSVEETSVAVHALSISFSDDQFPALQHGLEWLILHTERGTRLSTAPIGLYFAKLWYFEELYPLIFSAGALISAKAALQV
jgi:squalene-hopene/tetraprenyl-beta-curcumene cyclase